MKITIYIYADWRAWSKAFEYCVRSYEVSDMLLIEKREIEFESLTDAQLRNAMHKVLMHKREEVLADASVAAANIKAEADELLCLDYKEDKDGISI